MRKYHKAWLASHPERSPSWLAARLAEGFDIHHIDGNRGNDTPGNLVLIEGRDHMKLHRPAPKIYQDGRVVRRVI